MDAKLFTAMLCDKKFHDLNKMQYKYSCSDVAELVALLKETLFETLDIADFHGNSLVYLKNRAQSNMRALKILLKPQYTTDSYSINSMEDEINASLAIENIASSRNSIRKILNGYAPTSDSENTIYGIKRGLDFIADTHNNITEENLNTLYQISLGDFLEDENKILPTHYYRHDSIFVAGGKKEHQGLPHRQINAYMKKLIHFINGEDTLDDLLKAAVIHFYMGYIHPYFDGNGRTARLMHLWYLVQRGFSSTLFVPFSRYINETRARYYEAFTLVEQNAQISGVVDVTPFLHYFTENVYSKLGGIKNEAETIELFRQALSDGKITEKERDLWDFILSTYGTMEFSTKQLERDFQNAAYATIRGFVLKFESLGLLHSQKYCNKVKYRVV